jgi:DNA-binding HxlR family transcriptional regulator
MKNGSETGSVSLLRKELARGNVLEKECPSRRVLQDVTSRWGVLVLFSLLDETYRFSELRKKIVGISEKMLSQTLQALEADGFVLRTVHPVIPPHVEYQLTESGIEVAQRLEVLVNWIELNLDSIQVSQQRYHQQR